MFVLSFRATALAEVTLPLPHPEDITGNKFKIILDSNGSGRLGWLFLGKMSSFFHFIVLYNETFVVVFFLFILLIKNTYCLTCDF